MCGIHLHNKSALELFTSGKLKLFDAVDVVDSGVSQIMMVDSRDALHIPFDDIMKYNGKTNVGGNCQWDLLSSSVFLLAAYRKANLLIAMMNKPAANEDCYGFTVLPNIRDHKVWMLC